MPPGVVGPRGGWVPGGGVLVRRAPIQKLNSFKPLVDA